MRPRTAFLIIGLLLTAVFLFINWAAFSTPARLNFLFGVLEIPIGVTILGLLAGVSLLFAIYVGLWQATMLMDYRRQSKELQAQRTLADDAEASRFTELGNVLREEMAKLDQKLQSSVEALSTAVHESERSIAAALGEMDDRLRGNAGRS